MKKTVSTLAVALSLAAAACVVWAQSLIDGTITKVDTSAGKITIKHGPIKKFDMVVARRRKQDSLHPRAKGLGGPRQEHVAHGLGARRSARFPRHQHIVTVALQRLGEAADLRGFPSAFPALKRNEQSRTG